MAYKRYILIITVAFAFSFINCKGQDTFSIVAIDSLTGEIGSAGASCVGSSNYYPHGAKVLSDVIPGIGVIHTQAYYHSTNQQNAHNQMIQGNSPQAIIDWLITHDVSNNPSVRQYGIADYNMGFPRSAGYTGSNCEDYKNHITGPGYSIQGNILLGQEILDSMETRYLNTTGSLSVKLMAALQGAKVIGADTRCASPYNSSYLSSFIRVGRLGDDPDSLYLDLWMAYPQNFSGEVPADPIDSLQTLFDLWYTNTQIMNSAVLANYKIFNDGHEFIIRSFNQYEQVSLNIYDIYGRAVHCSQFSSPELRLDLNMYRKGIYLLILRNNSGKLLFADKFLKN